MIAKAPTGTGKTFAFGIPMIEHIDAASNEVQALILAPTRELAIQIGDELRGLLTYLPAFGWQFCMAVPESAARFARWRKNLRLW